jgi:trans-aconitate methyltransferase
MTEKPYTQKHNSWVDDFTIDQLSRIRPSHVVDIGCGDGFYGKLCKYVLGESVIVTGVDANPKWSGHCGRLEEYSEVIHGCIIEVLPQLKGELIIAGDVLEHLEELDMKNTLEHMCRSFKYIIINSPLGFQPQHHKDIWEHHRCGLDRTTFEGYRVIEYNESSHMGNEMFNVLIQGENNE